MTKQNATPPADTILKALPPIDELIVAIGIGAIVFLRPWFDGITFPEYNVPFTWACGALAAFWAVMVLLGRMNVRFLFPVSLLAVFLLVAVATAPFSVQYDATYRGLINWSGNLLLFCVAANGLRSRASIAIVIGCFAVTSVAEAIWAVLHVTYVMPGQRAAVMRDPSLIPTLFGTDKLTPDMSARLESNRASGSLLFANALACWLLTGIPAAISATNGLYIRLTQALANADRDAKSTDSRAERSRVLYATIAVGTVLFVAITFYYLFYFALAYREDADIGKYWLRWMMYCTGVPLVLTIVAAVYASRYGARAMLLAFAMAGSGLFGITAVYGLGATYSRGGMLACAGSLIVLVGLMYNHKRIASPQSANRAAAMLIVCMSLLPFMQTAFSQQSDAKPLAPATQAAPDIGNLALEGHNPSMQAMMDPNTALLRFGYWISGLHMFAAHPITGVGLGNFGTAYPHYQIVGAGDVKPAHNDYLQAASETGIFGLIAFLGFWAYFAAANARSILRESDRAMRWFRAGVFAGVIGFLLHSFVDFNFFNASLAALAFVMAGLSYAFMPDDRPSASSRGRIVAIAMLALIVWTLYAGARISSVDTALGLDTTRRVRLATVDMMLDQTKSSRDFTKPFAMFESTIALLIEDPAVRDTMGNVLIPTGPNTFRHSKKGEVLPPGARRIMPPESLTAVRKAALDAVRVWTDRCIRADAGYPHNPELSAHIVQWWEKLRQYSPDPAEKVHAADEEIEWSEECIRRSPLQTAYYDALAKALWDRGELETSTKQLEYYDRAIENWRLRAELYPVKPTVWREYAANCIAYGKQRVKAGDDDGGQKLIDLGNQANKHADDLDAQIQKVALGRG